MRNRIQIYWLSQVGGWGLFVLGNILIAYIGDQPVKGIYTISLLILVVGIATTHLYRKLVHRWRWKQLNIPALIPRMFMSSILMSFLFTSANTLFMDALGGQVPLSTPDAVVDFWQNTINFSALFLLWNIIYFAVNTFESWKREEITNLELRASKTEIELNSFRAQMNPHFMFNSMNSIRALVDENPDKAKQAITMLSGLLRNNLTLGRHQTIPLRDEMNLVDKYLSLEKIRFEERLLIQLDISPETLLCEIPPFMLQTIVENGIKYGISRRVEGGRLYLKTMIEGEMLKITTINSGIYNPEPGREGIGLTNTRKRLHLLYDGRASLQIHPANDEVRVELFIPNHKSKSI